MLESSTFVVGKINIGYRNTQNNEKDLCFNDGRIMLVLELMQLVVDY